MQFFARFFLVVWIAMTVACGNADAGSSDDTRVNQTPATSGQEAGAASAIDAGHAAVDAGPGSATQPGPRDGGGGTGNAPSDAGPRSVLDGAQVREAGTSNGGGADASAGDGSANDGGVSASDSPCPSDGSPCKILPLGDSITYGLGTSDNSSYRVELFRKAQTAKQHITFVGSVQSGPTLVDGVSFPRNNEGHSGWTISQVAGLVPSPALTSHPNIVLLMAGTNDMYMGPADAPKRLGDLLDKLTTADPSMFIVVAQITPTSSFEDAVNTFNAALPAVVQARVMAGKHVKLVDMHTGFPSGALADGVHPTSEGYTWMAGVWYDAIKQWLR